MTHSSFHISTSRLSSRQGFTLVEVLVSSFLTLIILGMLFSVLLGTMNAWEGATSKLEASGDAQLGLDILKSDLTGLVVRQTQGNQEWLYSGPFHYVNGELQWGPGASTDVTNTWMTFLTPSIDRDMNEPGSIVGVSYRTAYFDPLSGDSLSTSDANSEYKLFALYKNMQDPTETFTNILRFGTTNELIGSVSGQGYWGDVTSTTGIYDVETDGFLMPNVVRFAVSWLVREPGVTELVRYDETHEIRLANALTIDTVPQPGSTLEAAEINITVISTEGMERFRFFAGTGNDAGELSRIVQEFGSTHTIRVPIEY